MLPVALCPPTAGKAPPSTHSPRSDAILSTPLCEVLREAGADRRVRAVVLRVDSHLYQVHPAWLPMSSACASHLATGLAMLTAYCQVGSTLPQGLYVCVCVFAWTALAFQ